MERRQTPHKKWGQPAKNDLSMPSPTSQSFYIVPAFRGVVWLPSVPQKGKGPVQSSTTSKTLSFSQVFYHWMLRRHTHDLLGVDFTIHYLSPVKLTWHKTFHVRQGTLLYVT